ncbi:uncharacterized protein LOC119178703 isoform X1 [Rhipicephalus microplus]|uniref:uncharacterized protein LOC119178703 isoform X1 n=1 Tax=Rhipicephalus microplus TaxID=6941 RepID=UPI003F6A8959
MPMGCTTAPTLGDDCCSAQQSQENTTFRSSQVAFTDEVAAIVEIGPLETLQTRASYSILQNDADISFKANTAIPFLWHYQLLPESRFYASDHDYCAKHHAGTQTGEKTNSTDAQCALSVKALKGEGTQTDWTDRELEPCFQDKATECRWTQRTCFTRSARR